MKGLSESDDHASTFIQIGRNFSALLTKNKRAVSVSIVIFLGMVESERYIKGNVVMVGQSKNTRDLGKNNV